jgi:hypothetical protein
LPRLRLARTDGRRLALRDRRQTSYGLAIADGETPYVTSAFGAIRIPKHLKMESKYMYNGCMKTTIDIPENELRDAMRFTRAGTKREAVVKILEEFNRRRRMAELVKYSGSFSDRFPTNDEIEAIDAKRDRSVNARPRR